jgi:polar amino acid transport system substrate-binding protein
MAALAAAVGILGAVHAVAADPPADALARMRARGTLRWGGDMQGGEPFVFQDPEDGRLVGFEVEIADALARRLGSRRSSCRTTGRCSSRRSSAATSTWR